MVGEKVSIIITTFNRAKLVGRAIQSALNQTYKNVEVIVVDDCSTDETEEVVKRYKEVKYIRNEKNRGGPVSRNIGLGVCTGEFVNFLDDDDSLHHRKIEKQLEKFKTVSDKVGVIQCDLFYDREDINGKVKNRKKGYIYRDNLKSYCVKGTHALLIRKKYLDMIGGWDERLKSGQEYDLNMRLSRFCKYDYVEEVLAYVNESDNQISFNFNKKLRGLTQLWNRYWVDFIRERVFIRNVVRFSILFVEYALGKVDIRIYLGIRNMTHRISIFIKRGK